MWRLSGRWRSLRFPDSGEKKPIPESSDLIQALDIDLLLPLNPVGSEVLFFHRAQWWLLMWGFGGIMGLFLWFVMFVLTGIRFGLYRWIFGYWILVWAYWDLVLPRHLGIPRFFLKLKYWLQRKLTVQECFFRIDGGVWWVCTNHYSYPTSCFVLIEPSCFNLLVGSEVWRWNLHISGINCLNDPKDCTVCITAWIAR